jgi:hypothetical protein
MLMANAAVSALLSPPANSPAATIAKDGAVFFGSAGKQPPARFVVINLPKATPAATTLSGSSALIDGEIQFDSYGETELASHELSRAVKETFLDWGGTLSDDTTIQFIEVTADHDAGYEVGAEGYVYRMMLRMQAFYTEAA